MPFFVLLLIAITMISSPLGFCMENDKNGDDGEADLMMSDICNPPNFNIFEDENSFKLQETTDIKPDISELNSKSPFLFPELKEAHKVEGQPIYTLFDDDELAALCKDELAAFPEFGGSRTKIDLAKVKEEPHDNDIDTVQKVQESHAIGEDRYKNEKSKGKRPFVEFETENVKASNVPIELCKIEPFLRDFERHREKAQKLVIRSIKEIGPDDDIWMLGTPEKSIKGELGSNKDAVYKSGVALETAILAIKLSMLPIPYFPRDMSKSMDQFVQFGSVRITSILVGERRPVVETLKRYTDEIRARVTDEITANMLRRVEGFMFSDLDPSVSLLDQQLVNLDFYIHFYKAIDRRLTRCSPLDTIIPCPQKLDKIYAKIQKIVRMLLTTFEKYRQIAVRHGYSRMMRELCH